MNNDMELINATKKRNLKKIKKLVENGANINEIWYGKTPLIYATKNGDEEIVNYLIAHGANINYVVTASYHDWLLKPKSLSQLTILTQIISHKYGYLDIIDVLIKEGDTPLMIAAENGHTKIVETLAYIIYEQEKWKRYQLKLPTFLNIATNNNVKTLQELANDVQKSLTSIDFRQPNPYQKLEINLNLAKLKINNEILNKIDERIEEKKSSLVKEANKIELQNKASTSKNYPYCTIL